MKIMLNQKGAVPILILIAAIGIVGVIALSNLAPFKDQLLSSLFPKPASHAATLTSDDIINNAMQLNTISGADDLTTEAQSLITKFVNDPKNYNAGIGVNFDSAVTHYTHFRGSVTSTLAPFIPLMPGSVSDPATLRGKLAARLKTEVTTHLFNQALWDYEFNSNSTTSTSIERLASVNPRVRIEWDHRWRGGSHWEKMYALWAYAYYTGDWATIQNNWNFIKTQYNNGYKTADNSQRVVIETPNIGIFRSGMNDLANGLTGYARMAEHFNDPTAPQARTEAKAALSAVLTKLDVSWSSMPAYQSWDNTPINIRGEWTPGYNLSPELGRWVNDQALTAAQNRLNEAITAGQLNNHYYAGFMNNFGGKNSVDEDLWGTAWLSGQLFLGRAWMLQTDPQTLRKEKPWHTVMGATPEYWDMSYYRSLYALISRHSQVSWVNAR